MSCRMASKTVLKLLVVVAELPFDLGKFTGQVFVCGDDLAQNGRRPA